MPVQAAAEYNLQYIRRLLVSGAIEGVNDLTSIRKTSGRCFGPRVYQEYIESQES